MSSAPKWICSCRPMVIDGTDHRPRPCPRSFTCCWGSWRALWPSLADENRSHAPCAQRVGALRTNPPHWISSAVDNANDEEGVEREQSSAARLPSAADARWSFLASTYLHRERTPVGCELLFSFPDSAVRSFKIKKIMGLREIFEHVGSLFTRLPSVRPSSLWWRSVAVVAVVHRLEWLRGTEKIINEDTEGSAAPAQGQRIAWIWLCPCGSGNGGLLRFPSGDKAARGCPLKSKSFSTRVGSQRRRKRFHLHDHGWARFLTPPPSPPPPPNCALVSCSPFPGVNWCLLRLFTRAHWSWFSDRWFKRVRRVWFPAARPEHRACACCRCPWCWARAPGMVETLSIAVIGAPGVGKTSVIRQFIYNDFSEVYTPTRTRYVYRPSVILNGNMYELKILDVPPISSFPSSSSQVSCLRRNVSFITISLNLPLVIVCLTPPSTHTLFIYSSNNLRCSYCSCYGDSTHLKPENHTLKKKQYLSCCFSSKRWIVSFVVINIQE